MVARRFFANSIWIFTYAACCVQLLFHPGVVILYGSIFYTLSIHLYLHVCAYGPLVGRRAVVVLEALGNQSAFG
jgi:hypothetical protein